MGVQSPMSSAAARLPSIHVNGVDLRYELTGDAGPAIVLVHGAWVDHTSWRLVAPALADAHRVVRYDRRGHSLSAGPGICHGSRKQQEDDLVGLIEALDLGPVHIVGTSYGGSIALAVATSRPDLVRSVLAHEPPLTGAARPDSSLADQLGRVTTLLALVVADLVRGKHERGAIRFVEELALGPGSWCTLPESTRHAIVANAPAFLDLVADPGWGSVPVPADSDVAVLLTDGVISPRWMPAIVGALRATAYAHAAHCTFDSAGHAPHLTHSTNFIETVASFVRGVDTALTGRRAA
jgi:pimeloyl-ACP methyl ester carboxylesterase